MMTHLVVFISLFLLAFVYIKVAEYFNIIDKPNQRSSHVEATIRGGGIIFYLAIILFFFISNFKFPYFFTAISIIAIISFVDDVITLGRRIRLFFHFLTAFLILIELGFIGYSIWLILLYLIGAVAFLNLYNFMDGINGLTGLYSLCVLASFLIINCKENIVDSRIIVFPLLSVIVFGYFNFRRKARFFAGDIGSMTIATLILFLGGLFVYKLNAPILLLLVSVYAIDGGLTIFFRFIKKENITEAHRFHLYQRLVDIQGYSHIKVSLIYTFLQSIINFGVLYFYKSSINIQLLLVIFILFSLGVCYFLLKLKYEKVIS